MTTHEIVLTKINEVFLQTSKITIEQQMELREAFSAKAKNWWFSPRAKMGWDGSIYYYNMSTGLFPIGMLPYFVNYCKKFNYTYKFDFNVADFRCNVADTDITKLYELIFKPSFKPREYQDHGYCCR